MQAAKSLASRSNSDERRDFPSLERS